MAPSSIRRLLFGSSSEPSPSDPHPSDSPDTGSAPSSSSEVVTSPAAPASTTSSPAMAASSSNGSGPKDKGALPFDRNVSAAGAQARLHAAGVAPEGTGSSLPSELRAGMATTPSSSALNQAAAGSEFNPSSNFSSAGAQARAAAAGDTQAPPMGTHSAYAAPSSSTNPVSPIIDSNSTAGIGSTSSAPSTAVPPSTNQASSNQAAAPLEGTTPQQPNVIHALNTIDELDDRSAPGVYQHPYQPPPPKPAPAVETTSPIPPPSAIHGLNTIYELSHPNNSGSPPAASSVSPGGAQARAHAAGAAPEGTVAQSFTSAPTASMRQDFETETKYQTSTLASELGKNFSPGGYAARLHAAGAAPEGTSQSTLSSSQPFGGNRQQPGTAPNPVTDAVSQGRAPDPNVSQAGLAARAGAAQQAPQGTGQWGRKSFSTLARTQPLARVARRGPAPVRAGAVAVAGLLIGGISLS